MVLPLAVTMFGAGLRFDEWRLSVQKEYVRGGGYRRSSLSIALVAREPVGEYAFLLFR